MAVIRLCLIAALVSFGPAGIVLAQQGSVIQLRSADKLEGRMVFGEEVRELTGNVHFVQPQPSGGLVRVWCDRALRYMLQDKVELFGRVKMIRDSVTIFADEGVYFASQRRVEVRKNVRLLRGTVDLRSRVGEHFLDEKRSRFTGDVILVDSTSTVTCDELTYLEDAARSIAVGNVRVVNHDDQATIFGDSLVHLDTENVTHVPLRPRLVQVDTASTGAIDTLIVLGRHMESHRGADQRFVATDSVLIVRNGLAARAGKAVFLPRADTIILANNPVVWYDDNQVSGDSMVIRLADRELRSVFVRGRAMAISRADTARRNRFDQLTGRELTMYFSGKKLQQVDVLRTATSMYYLMDDREPNGANQSSGDRIIIDFLDGKVDRIKIIGGVRGVYYPEQVLAGKEQEYNLDGFRWYTVRPVRRQMEIVNEHHD